MKLGQALALRFDILPPAYCYELFKLLYHMRPFPYEDVREIIQRDLGNYPEKLFSSFEPDPFAAASIGQVHRAILDTGEKVAVKVQRPEIRHMLAVDIELMYRFAGCFDFLRVLGATRTREIVGEFERWTHEELNFLHEGRHAYILGQNARGDSRERNAEVYWQYTSERILTTSLIEGEPLIDIIKAVRDRNTQYLTSLQSRGYNIDRIAHNILRNTLNQVFQQAYFHADLHPANLFVLPDNVIGYVDFGIVGTLPDHVRDSLAYYAWHLFLGNAVRSTEEFMRWVAPSAATDSSAHDEILRIAEEFVFSLRYPELCASENSFASYQIEILNAVRRHQMVISSDIVPSFKALIAATSLIYELNPKYDLRSDGSRFFSRMIRQDVRRWLDPREVVRLSFDCRVRLNRVFTALESLAQTGQEIGSKVRRYIQILAVLASLSAVGFYAVLTKRVTQVPGLSPEVTREWLPPFLLGAFVLLVAVLISQSRKLPVDGHRGPNLRRSLRTRWGRARGSKMR